MFYLNQIESIAKGYNGPSEMQVHISIINTHAYGPFHKLLISGNHIVMPQSYTSEWKTIIINNAHNIIWFKTNHKAFAKHSFYHS